MTTFLMDGTSVMSLNNLNTLRVLNISRGQLDGMSEMTTMRKSNTFHQLLKYPFP